MKTKRLSSVIAIIMTITVFILTLSPIATALFDKNGSITLNVTNPTDDTPLTNVSYRLYFFAKAYEAKGNINYKLIPPYDKANVDINDLQDPYLAVHLSYFSAANNLPYTEKSTDGNGVLVFSDLTPGLYLVVPSQTEDDHYTSSPFVISVPRYDSENKKWEFDIIASPKISGGEEGTTDTYISVLKKWEGNKKHPESITVVLLRDFKEYARVQLNDKNNWYYRWDNLSKDFTWEVVEADVPDGYTVYYDTSSNTVTIINKADTPGESTTTPTTKPGDTTTTKPSDNLAQTGQLNWPVPIFAIAGLLLFSSGWAILNLGKKESE